MSKNQPKKKVGLVTFNSDVTVIGDGQEKEQIISGDKLQNYENLTKNGEELGVSMMSQGIGKTSKSLVEKMYKIQETGPTALGPALLTSIALASKGGAGSSVVLCTDGLANVGLGALEEAKGDEEK